LRPDLIRWATNVCTIRVDMGYEKLTPVSLVIFPSLFQVEE
jgi:hypothetical protein